MTGYDSSWKTLPPLPSQAPSQTRISYSDLPEAVQAHCYPEVAHSAHSYPGVVHTQIYPEVVLGNGPEVIQRHEADKYLHVGPPPVYPYESSFRSATGTEKPPPPPPVERNILGIRRKTFFIIAGIVAALVLIAVIVGISVGVTTASKSSSLQIEDPLPPPSSNDTSNNTGFEFFPPTNLLQGSSLASANFTDPQGVIHLYVYTQDASNALLVSSWDSAGRTWQTASISKSLPTKFDLLPGTPISAYMYTNPAFQARIYVLTKDYMIREFLTTSPSGLTGWKQGVSKVVLGLDKLIKVHPKSKLAALRPQCGTGDDCRNKFPPVAVAYQDPDGRVQVTNANKDLAVTGAGEAAEGTVLGLTSLMTGGNISDVNWKLHFEGKGTGELKEFAGTKEFPVWIERRSLGKVPNSAAVKNIAAFSFDLVNIMLLSLGEDGGVNIRTMVKDAWTINQVPSYTGLDGKNTPPAKAFKFSAIAGNPEKRVFGLVKGNVFEWRFTSGNLTSWEFVGRVPIALD
ncbi:hypothetical protein QBC35DRAFT_467998 [Podospora australis]|uniref:Fucose-specific lectin n=1 Tax=Podospora australis TaxID=1536484 RepID=A0AAN7ADI0_9PEZI|nr:hypothetical protein QBC35DRAFT_467998 [Podospora australis]